MATFYSLDAIQKIMMYEPPYSLSSSVISILKNLEVELGGSSAAIEKSQPLNRSTSSNHRRRQPPSSSSSNHRKMDEPWEAVPALKATVFVQREGIEKKMGELRNMLNKISTKTYDILKQQIMELVREIIGENGEQSDASTIVEFIFEIASSNKFYSELYAQLYAELIEQFAIFSSVLEPFLQKYVDSIETICVVDQNVDYNAFCENNKKNEKRKATSVFVVNLLKNSVLSIEKTMGIIDTFQEYAMRYVEEEGRTVHVEEITENIFLLITLAAPVLKTEALWKSTVEPKIRQFAGFKAKDKKSLSSRAVFKYMDIVEKHL